MLHFWKKIKKNTSRYHYQNLHDMIYSFWDIEHNILKWVILGHFLPFYPRKNPKNQNFGKWKNLLKTSSFYICVTKITIIWCTIPEIRSETQNFLSFWAIFCPFNLPSPPPSSLPSPLPYFTYVYHKWQ